MERNVSFQFQCTIKHEEFMCQSKQTIKIYENYKYFNIVALPGQTRITETLVFYELDSLEVYLILS